MWLQRLETLVGENNINKIKNTHVLIIGLGGVGSYALESIVRSGIEKITIVDRDVVDITNLNRQLITDINNIGEDKVDVAEKRILTINPNIEVIKIKQYISSDNIDILFPNPVDYIIDACDCIETKKQLIRECIKRKVRLISSMATAKKMDATKLEIIDIRDTQMDPIARILRKMMKDEEIKGKVMVVCSKEKPIKMDSLGSNSFVPATAGLLCASYVINDIVGDINEIN